MNKKLLFRDLGTMDYQKAWDLQEEIFQQMMAGRTIEMTEAGRLLFVEHPHVYTLGKSGSDSNLLVNEDFLRSKGATFYHINRGGDITYHGPGQLVGYPILNLERFGLGLRDYIYRLEEAVIRTLKHFSIEASRLEGAIGVWLDPEDKAQSRKICAIGVRASRSITMHGFAFNINTDLDFYNFINPCGFTDRGVTSMEKELGSRQDLNSVKDLLKTEISQVFDAEILD
ncbi:MAG: lipoyl(octanoyl) transferase LipB [Bacteroidetes bacterium]|nr:lipoyl(octanoyl) transferase LipB [Bacteroidota bacterium]MBU1579653.1 lipoyl(octanoyl) transferase LipB [Bacteroidota bacterium]MBU2557450.1 lipoyl(octanoyl) transferase LipB [Bacteroidota bacterium]